MGSFIVTLAHPDGSLRKVARDNTSGKLAITTLGRSNKKLPYALFESEEEAQREVIQFISLMSEFLENFPVYTLIVEPGIVSGDH